ncbi:MAG: dihydropteroate synthase [Lachnospiraceae bacterium]|nr:dihydropteroate synthase [Lachnospiraceae bacterium]
MRIGTKEFDTTNHTYLMGILNITPDSFSDGGKYHTLDAALFRVEEMLKEGMDILDIGGESTRPGYIQISDDEEIGRIVPVIEAVKERFDVPVSLDTYKGAVAKAGIRSGADLINDIWGLQYDPEMGKIIADSQVACCLMHNRKEADYTSFMEDMAADFTHILHTAEAAGISKDKIILDPGVGFGKTYEQNLAAIGHLKELQTLGYPLLLGTSRKSVIGLTLNVEPEERLIGTVVTGVFGILQGCSFLRVHDIKAHAQAIKMAEAILGQMQNSK